MTLRQFMDAAYAYLVQKAQESGMGKDGKLYPGMTLSDALERYEPYRAVTLGTSTVRPDPIERQAAQNDKALRSLMGQVRMQGARG